MTDIDRIKELHPYMPTNFQDTRGGNMMPNSQNANSENPTTFNVAYHFLYDEVIGLDGDNIDNLYGLLSRKLTTNGNKFKTNDYDDNDSFSLDESVSMAAMGNHLGLVFLLSKIKVWTKSTWFRFYDVVPYLLLCKYKWTRWLLVPQMLVMIFMLLSSFKPMPHTSGKQLNFIKAKGLEGRLWMDLTWILCEMIVDYKEVFNTYYPEKEHPTRKLAQLAW